LAVVVAELKVPLMIDMVLPVVLAAEVADTVDLVAVLELLDRDLKVVIVPLLEMVEVAVLEERVVMVLLEMVVLV
jgi:hypothetical protein